MCCVDIDRLIASLYWSDEGYCISTYLVILYHVCTSTDPLMRPVDVRRYFCRNRSVQVMHDNRCTFLPYSWLVIMLQDHMASLPSAAVGILHLNTVSCFNLVLRLSPHVAHICITCSSQIWRWSVLKNIEFIFMDSLLKDWDAPTDAGLLLAHGSSWF